MPDTENRDPALTAALAELAEADGNVGASPMVEARLLSEVRSITRARARRQIAAFALAAAVLLAVALPLWRLVGSRARFVSPVTSIVSSREIGTEFFPLMYSSVPLTGGQLVRMEVPRSSLAQFGLTFGGSSGGSASGTVLADVIVGEDGLARAVRFVRPALGPAAK
jgi:hypothetical protein